MIHDVSEVTEGTQDFDYVDYCLPSTPLKLHGNKRKCGGMESKSSEHDTSSLSSNLDKKASTPKKKMFEQIFKDSPSASASASTSHEVIDLTKPDDLKELSTSNSDSEKMVDYPTSGKCRQQKEYLQHDILKVLCYDANKHDITNAVGKLFPFIQAIFNKNVQNEASQRIMEMNEKYLIGNDDYYKFCHTDDTRYWEIDLITNFSVFKTLLYQQDDLCFVENLPNNYGGKKGVPKKYVVPQQYKNKSLFTTVVYRDGHYATLSLNRNTKQIHARSA